MCTENEPSDQDNELYAHAILAELIALRVAVESTRIRRIMYWTVSITFVIQGWDNLKPYGFTVREIIIEILIFLGVL